MSTPWDDEDVEWVDNTKPATSMRNNTCGCVIEFKDAPFKAWSCEHGQYWVAADYYEQWVQDGRPLGIIR